MFHWQLVALVILFITTITISWPTDIDNTKVCFHFEGAFGGDVKCDIYCKGRGKTGGSCKKKRCVCNNGQSSDEDSREYKPGKQQLPFFAKSNLNVNCNADLMICELKCKNMGKSSGSCINQVCVCSRI